MVLAAFLVALAFVVVGIVVCVVRALRLWRQAKATGKAFSAEVSKTTGAAGARVADDRSAVSAIKTGVLMV